MIAPSRRLAGLIAAAALIASACGNAATTVAPTVAATTVAASVAPASAPPATPITGGLLDKVLKAGELRIATDKDYAPQSFLKPDGTFEGFDIDVGKEIAKRLGVKATFLAESWDIITAGSWASRWDVSVGSMTITVPRQAVLAFTSAYYYTPAQMTATTKSGITTMDGLAGKTICVGTATTYQDWLEGKLQTVSLGPVATPPAGVKVKTLESDNNCAEAISAGQNVGDGFLSSSTVIDSVIENGTPIVRVGDPVYVEQLAASCDKGGADPTDFITAVTKIIDDMHADGTLSAMSLKWFKLDLTNPPPA
jgi:polar amino acid transport system substrate-binding protein